MSGPQGIASVMPANDVPQFVRGVAGADAQQHAFLVESPPYSPPLDALPMIPVSLQYPRLVELPYEVLSRVFWHLDAPGETDVSFSAMPISAASATVAFAATCRRFHSVSKDPYARCGWLVSRYGSRMAMFYAFKFHRGIFTPEVAGMMLAIGCLMPRFLVQLVDREYHQNRTERLRRPVSVALFMFFMQAGYLRYGDRVDFRDDDVTRFERCAYGEASTSDESTELIRDLIINFHFVPVRGLGSPIDETVYLVSKLDLSLIPILVRNGMEIADVNDSIMERVLWRSDVTDQIVAAYMRVGFRVTSPAIKKGLQMGRAATIDILRNYVSPTSLQAYAEETVVDMFGPSIRGWSFTPEAISLLLQTFTISQDVMLRAILRHPNGGVNPEAPDAFPATRSYMKANPCPVWRWILQTYGPGHNLTIACFEDAISRAAADRELHALHDVFLEAGVQFRPRHVKILACRVLHRDMTANALHLLHAMREQLIRTTQYRFPAIFDTRKPSEFIPTTSSSLSFLFGNIKTPTTSAGPSRSNIFDADAESNSSDDMDDTAMVDAIASPVSTDSIKHLSAAECAEWIRAFEEEVTCSSEWDVRMRTTQLEGGPRGGAYRITRPPEDALRFLDVARETVIELKAAMAAVGAPAAAAATDVGEPGNSSGSAAKRRLLDPATRGRGPAGKKGSTSSAPASLSISARSASAPGSGYGSPPKARFWNAFTSANAASIQRTQSPVISPAATPSRQSFGEANDSDVEMGDAEESGGEDEQVVPAMDVDALDEEDAPTIPVPSSSASNQTLPRTTFPMGRASSSATTPLAQASPSSSQGPRKMAKFFGLGGKNGR
ncbi:hypothetical protein HDU84_004071 [Entophlyctis sp. JEL0112]|nr:hypothetical protein HDU84_004071 [Entophlyctis sp. JEL0112]